MEKYWKEDENVCQDGQKAEIFLEGDGVPGVSCSGDIFIFFSTKFEMKTGYKVAIIEIC